MKTILLTPLQTFHAMNAFLEDYYYKSSSNDIGALLGAMQLHPDGETFDPALWHDWVDYLGDQKKVTSDQAYKAMLKLLDFYIGKTDEPQTQAFILGLQLEHNGTPRNPAVWQDWMNCITRALSHDDAV